MNFIDMFYAPQRISLHSGHDLSSSRGIILAERPE